MSTRRNSYLSFRTVRGRRAATAAVALALAASVLGVAPAVAAAAPGDSGSTVASLSAPNASGSPAPDPSSGSGATTGNLIKIPPASAATPAQQASMDTAAAQAEASGRPVPVTALTDELSQVVAQPDGHLTVTANVTPVRTRQGGHWVPIDTALRQNPDGSLSPRATAYGTVRFSDGGAGPLAVTTSGGTSYAVSWPGVLPTPHVSGPTATYADVLPGVDLQVRSTDTGGFSTVLIVKSAAAAHNPKLRTLTLPTRVTGGEASRSPAGTGLAVNSGRGGLTLESSGSLMWDSNTSLAAINPKAASARVQPSPDPSNAGHAGLAARLAPVTAKATASTLTLIPDPALLTGAHTVYPLYIDPTEDWTPITGGTPDYADREQGSPCTGTSFWHAAPQLGNTGEHALGIGDNLWSSCFGLMDPYFQWKLPAAIHGALIQNATVKVTRNYSSACGSTSSATLHWSGGINSGTSWASPKPADLGHAVTQSWPAQTGLNCSGGDIAEGFDLTSAVASNTNAPQITVELEADGDPHGANGVYWYGNIQPNPTLQITYNIPASTPTNPAAVTGSDNVGCATSAPYPYMGKTLATNTPRLQAQVHDPDGGHVQATFQYWIDGSSTINTGLSTDSLADGATATYPLPASFVSALTNGQTVDWKVQDSDGGPPSPWSPTCHFTAEPTGPAAPAIPDNTTYPNTSTGGGVGATAGTGAAFTLNDSTTGSPATSFVYALDQQPATSNPPASQIATAASSAAPNAADRWKLTEGSGPSGADSTGTKPVTLTNATWASDSQRGTVLATNGTNAYAATAGPALTTTASYSVSTWAYLTSTANFATFLSQAGAVGSAFYLQYSHSTNAWAFVVQDTDTTSPVQTTIHASTAPALNTWTNLVGVYDATAKTASLYINGALVGTGAVAATFNAAGPLVIGAVKTTGGTVSNQAPGRISDAQAYSRALTATDIATIYDSARVTITPQSNGPHTLWVYARDAAGDSNIGWASYPFIAQGHPNTVCASFAACLNNTAISPDNNESLGAADSWHSFSATDLTNAGWKSGQSVTVNGATFTLPAYGTGQPDNILAANQTLPITGTGTAVSLLVTATNVNATISAADPNYNTAPYVPTGTAIADNWCYLGTSAQAPCAATSGTITYSDGTTSPYDLTVPEWCTGPSSIAAVTLPHRNAPTGQQNATTKIYDFTVPLTANKPVQSITLPDLNGTISALAPEVHVFAIALRNINTATTEVNTTTNPNTATTATLPANTAWTGAWANPTEGQYNFQGSNFSNQTIRIALKPSISGSSVRIKLDNALGTNALSIGHATIALDATSGGLPTAQPAGAFTNLTFGGQPGATIPAGAMAYADPPASYSVTANQYLLVSFTLTNSVPYLVQHSWANTAYEYLSAAGSGDKTTDSTGTPFTGTGTTQGWFTDLLTDLDVATTGYQTPGCTGGTQACTTGFPTQAVLGDGLIDAWQPNTSPIGSTSIRLSDNLAAAEPSTPLPYGTIAEGIESNQITTDNPETYQGGAVGGPSALSRLDRDILDHPGITTVLVYEGLDDVLNGATEDSLYNNGYTALNQELTAFGITPVYVLLTPCDGYTGDGATNNDPCTATVDNTRLTVNKNLTNYPYYIDAPGNLGIPDTGNGETKLDPNAQVSDHVNLSIPGYAALADAYLIPQDTWPLGDGANGNTTVTTAQDTAATGTAVQADPYLGTMPTAGQNPINLNGTNGTDYTWATDATRGTVLNLNGTTGYGTTGTPVINTAQSFTVSAWVNLTSLPTRNAVVASQDGATNSGFYLGYNYTHANKPAWDFYFATTDTTNPGFTDAASSTAATGWTHLVGVYNATTKTAQLYVNGTLTATATGITGWNTTGTFTLGRDLYNRNPTDYFPGEISNLQDWDYALSTPQITALYNQIQ